MEVDFREARIRIEYGFIQGRNEDGVKKFLGVPYGKPPVGNLRLRAPEKPAPWKGLRACRFFPPEPLQVIDADPYDGQIGVYANSPMSEDCLYLNVFTPAERQDEKLPVFVFIHGGGFNTGSCSHQLYPSERLAKLGNMVVVLMNYRLGALGFMALPELSAENGGHSGNWGLMDQNLALRFVKDNIAAFGGDPEKIFVSGQSAGAMSVGAHFVSPKAAGLFAAAGIQSGSIVGRAMKTLKDAEKDGLEFMKVLGVSNLEELRALSGYEIFDAENSSGMRFSPIVDGAYLPESAEDLIQKGEFNRVPLLVGCTSEEHGANPDGIDPAKFEAFVRERIPDGAEEILSVYPHGTRDEAAMALTHLIADASPLGVRKLAKMLNAQGDDAVYTYYFSREAKAWPLYGAPHTLDITYLFHYVDCGGPYAWSPRKWSDEDRAFSLEMMRRWRAFADGGQPGPDWKPYQDGGFTMELGEEITPLGDRIDERLRVQEKYGKEIAGLYRYGRGIGADLR